MYIDRKGEKYEEEKKIWRLCSNCIAAVITWWNILAVCS